MTTLGWVAGGVVVFVVGAAVAVVAAARLMEQLDEPVFGGDL